MSDRFDTLAPYAVVAITVLFVVFASPRRESPEAAPAVSQATVDASSRTPRGMVVNWARTELAQQRHPESLVWERLLANRDGSVVCLAYRVPGGEAAERVSYVAATGGARRAAWDEACGREVTDMTDAAPLIAMR